MTALEIEVKFTLAVTGVSEEHIAQAKRKAQEALRFCQSAIYLKCLLFAPLLGLASERKSVFQ
jgi:hypothetical protein